MNWLRSFMMGRYGNDQLNIGLLVLSILITFTASIINRPILSYIGYIPLLLCFYRMFSRNIERRRMENYKFNMLLGPVYSWFRRTSTRAKDRENRHFKCPNCGQGLYVPKGKGKIVITCPKCRKEFSART